MATLLHEMKRRGKDCRFGVISMCIGVFLFLKNYVVQVYIYIYSLELVWLSCHVQVLEWGLPRCLNEGML